MDATVTDRVEQAYYSMAATGDPAFLTEGAREAAILAKHGVTAEWSEQEGPLALGGGSMRLTGPEDAVVAALDEVRQTWEMEDGTPWVGPSA